MTGVLIQRGNLYTETGTLGEQDVKREAGIGSCFHKPRNSKVAWKPPEARRQGRDYLWQLSERRNLVHTLILDFWPPELHGDKSLSCKPPSSWHFVVVGSFLSASLAATRPVWAFSHFSCLLSRCPHLCDQVALVVKNLPADSRDTETWVRSLGREDALEEEMLTHSRVLAWRVPWTGEPGELQSMGSQRVGHDWSGWAHVKTLKNSNENHSLLSYKWRLGGGDPGWVPYAIFSGRGFPGSSESKVSACNARDPGLIPGLGRSPGEGNGNPLQDCCLENSMDGGAW